MTRSEGGQRAPGPPGVNDDAAHPDLQDRPVDELRNVGPQIAAVLRSKGFSTIGDVLAHLPRRYLDLRNADDWRLVRNGAWGSLVASPYGEPFVLPGPLPVDDPVALLR